MSTKVVFRILGSMMSALIILAALLGFASARLPSQWEKPLPTHLGNHRELPPLCGCQPTFPVCASNFHTYPSECDMSCGDYDNRRYVLFQGSCEEVFYSRPDGQYEPPPPPPYRPYYPPPVDTWEYLHDITDPYTPDRYYYDPDRQRNYYSGNPDGRSPLPGLFGYNGPLAGIPPRLSKRPDSE